MVCSSAAADENELVFQQIFQNAKGKVSLRNSKKISGLLKHPTALKPHLLSLLAAPQCAALPPLCWTI